jgi:hypothetical protein
MWINSENIKKISQSQEATYHMIPFIWNIQNQHSIETVNQWLPGRDCKEEGWEVTANRCDEIFVQLDSSNDCATVNILKTSRVQDVVRW